MILSTFRLHLKVFIDLMTHAEDELQAKATVLLADLASVTPAVDSPATAAAAATASAAAQLPASESDPTEAASQHRPNESKDAIYRNIPALLASGMEHVLVHVTNYIRVLAIREPEYQNRIAQLEGVLQRIVTFLYFEDSPMLRFYLNFQCSSTSFMT